MNKIPILCPISSSSEGNCFLIRNYLTTCLIDCGISYRKLKQELNTLDLSVCDIEAVFITHEHQDHTRGLKMLQQEQNVKIFTNLSTAEEIRDMYDYEFYFHIFSNHESFEFKGIECTPFQIPHDAADPVGFRFRCGDITIGFCTDCGFVTSRVIEYLSFCDYLILESNYDPTLLDCSKRPHLNKQRVKGRFGHLSNEQCASLLNKIAHVDLKHVYIGHISGDCNTVDIIKKSLHSELIQICERKRITKPVQLLK